MVIPDFANAYSALDAHWTPLATFGELLDFLSEAGERVAPNRVYAAICEYQRNGAVLALHRWGHAPRYALRTRLVFRRSLLLAPHHEGGPWAS